MDGIEAARRLVAMKDAPRILMLTTFDLAQPQDLQAEPAIDAPISRTY